MHDVELKIGSRLFAGWESVSINRSMDTISGTFRLEVSDKWRDGSSRWQINPLDSVEILVDREIVITGHVDDVNRSYSGTDHRIVVAGRDRAGDLVDCSAGTNLMQWKNRSLSQIIASVCEPFSIKVIAETDVGEIFPDESVQDSETAFELIDRLCRQRGILAVSDGLGNLILTRATARPSGGALRYGQNIREGAGVFSMRDRFSSYQVKGQQRSTSFVSETEAASPSVTVRDPAVTRFRPLIMLAETQGDPGRLKKRAIFERNVRGGKSTEATYTVHGWRVKGDTGNLWQPNRRVPVEDDFLGINREMLITAVEFSKSDQGTLTRLTVARPESYDLLDFPEGA